MNLRLVSFMSNKPKPGSCHGFPGLDPECSFTLVNRENVSLGDLFSQAQQISLSLPEGRYALNLCRDRYLFTVCYLAVIFRSQINLLPQNQSPGCIQNLLENYSGSYTISDDPASQYPGFIITPGLVRNGAGQFPGIAENCIVSISFTSGSTGNPKPIPKTIGEFLKSARLATDRLGIASGLHLVSTVPPQHMYGLETSVFWPLVAGATIQSYRPFFPEDIRRTLSESAKPCLLISTPTHLKACVESNLCWTNLAGVLSSTAAMPVKLAKTIESRFGVPLLEIFGSTETLSFASRRLTVSEQWQPYQSIRVRAERDFCTVQGGHLRNPLRLDDRLEIDQNGCFTLTGRSSDLVKIGGKRASLAELNRLINEIEGVRDGLFYFTEHGRLGALVISRRSKKAILAELRKSIDEVFLPRPFYRIQEIPRNELGKIVKLKLDRLIRAFDIA
ncbi:MAG: AMP-binding protein [Methylococcales bacterium]